MRRPRIPVVLGLGPGVGAGTVAAALHAREGDPGPRLSPDGTRRARPGGVPHLVPAVDAALVPSGRGGRRPAGANDGHSSAALPPIGSGRLAADIVVCSGDDASLQRAAALRGAPVLVVVLVEDGPSPSQARRRELRLRHGGVAVLPHVRHWSGLGDAPDEAAVLLAQRPEHLPPVLRAYASGLRLALTALLHSGVLTRPGPLPLTWSPPAPRNPLPADPTRPGPAAPLPASPTASPPPRPLAPAAAPPPPLGNPAPAPDPAPTRESLRTAPGSRGPMTALTPGSTRAARVPEGSLRPTSGSGSSSRAAAGRVADELDDEAIEAEALAAGPGPGSVTAMAG